MLAALVLLIAVAGAIWQLFRLRRDEAAAQARSNPKAMTTFKLIVWLALSAALLAAKLWPLAFMVLLAAGGVSAIEAWRGRAQDLSDLNERPSRPPAKVMSEEEALSVLGLKPGASGEDVRAAHRKLIAQLHPDKGGTDYLAAKINEARDHLLRGLE